MNGVNNNDSNEKIIGREFIDCLIFYTFIYHMNYYGRITPPPYEIPASSFFKGFVTSSFEFVNFLACLS